MTDGCGFMNLSAFEASGFFSMTVGDYDPTVSLKSGISLELQSDVWPSKLV